MTSTAGGGTSRTATAIRISRLPAATLSASLVLLAVLATPQLLERAVSLDWWIGTLRPAAHGLQLLLLMISLAVWCVRARINAFWARTVPSRKELCFFAIGITTATALTLAGLEVGMRALDVPFRTTWTPPEYVRARFDGEVGWTYAPNWSGVQTIRVGEQRVDVPMYFDELGLRVRQPGWKHNPAVPTVLFVGCSFTAGYGLPYEETFAEQLDRHPRFPYQAVNLGVEAYGTDQALLLLRRHFPRFNTKVVVYTFISDHVPRNENYDRRLLFRGARFVGTKPLFGLDGDGGLILRKPPLKYEDLAYSRVGATVQFAWTKWGPKPTLDLTTALVAAMKAYVESHGATFVMVAWDWDRAPLFPRSSDWPPFRELHLNVVDTAAGAPPDWQRWRIPGDSHPNARAHARIAQLLVDELQRLGLISP